MEGLCRQAIEAAVAAGASYADARCIDQRTERARVKNGATDGLVDERSQGLGVRVIADGAWGFSGTADLSGASIREAARRAVELARAAAPTVQDPVALAPLEPVTDSVTADFEIDPGDVSQDDRLALLMDCDRLMRREGADLSIAYCSVLRREQHFCSSEGASIFQERIETGAGVEATAVAEDQSHRRSYPSSHGGQVMARGWEVVEELELAEHAPRVAAEARQLIDAPACPSGRMDLILGRGQLALQVHESCGHPIELDRVLGTEASFAGTSFLTPEKLGSFRYGS
ncbi:MAG: DNA gyrase modulator, partial [Armatimonadota bacterium]|nr:DNA gyrase modulator [Armatimonadota bacterium]